MKTDVITSLTQLAAVQLSEEAVQEGKVREDWMERPPTPFFQIILPNAATAMGKSFSHPWSMDVGKVNSLFLCLVNSILQLQMTFFP